jgi:transposase
VLRDPVGRRARSEVLRRALTEIGVSWRCDECGIGPTWHGRPLTLQVDHRNGKPWDRRPENVRPLCPNCHSQTPTYAGRNRRKFGWPAGQNGHRPAVDEATEDRPDGSPTGSEPVSEEPVSEETVLAMIDRVDRRELTATEAARLIGCHRNHFYRLRHRLAEQGSLRPRHDGRRWRSAVHREKVIAYALTYPDLGPKTIARRLRKQGPPSGCTVSHGTVSNILREAGLNTALARRSRLIPPAGVV